MNNLRKWLFERAWTDAGLLVLRVAFGAGIAYHGFGKVTGDMTQFAAGVSKLGFPLPLVFAWAAALSEFLGGILLAIGFLSRPAALFIVFTMAVAAFGAHGADPFKKKELALLYLFASAALSLTGAGRFSADSLLRRKKEETPAA